MQEDQNSPIAEGNQSVDESLSQEGLMALMAQEENPEQETTEETESTETEGEEVDETTETQEEEIEEEPEVDSEIEALLKLPTDQLKELAKKGGSKALERFAELTWRARHAEEQLQAYQQTQQPAPAEPVDSRFLKGVDSADKLTAKVTELKNLAKTAERLLDENEDMGPEDLIEYGEQTFTKKQLKALRREVRETLDEAVPSMQAQLRQREAWGAQEGEFLAAAKKQIPEIESEETEVGKKFKGMLEDPLLKKVREQVPEIAPQLAFLLAHACRSLFGKTGKAAVAPATGKTARAIPPTSPQAGAAVSGKPVEAKAKRVQTAQKQYEDNPTKDNLIALEIAEQS